ncbi:unnamed protein product, partial [Hapterophycus canaliculatus]
RTVVSSTSESFVGLAFDSNNSILYGVTPETDALYTINTTTGASSIIGSGLGITGGISINTGLAYDIGLGQLFLTRSAFDANDGLYLVDPLTGSASSQGGFGQTGNFSGLASTAATAVPEPSSAILISLLSLGLVVHRRQRRS